MSEGGWACRVRHEAGEALGASGNSDCIAHLERHQQDACLEVYQPSSLGLGERASIMRVVGCWEGVGQVNGRLVSLFPQPHLLASSICEVLFWM